MTAPAFRFVTTLIALGVFATVVAADSTTTSDAGLPATLATERVLLVVIDGPRDSETFGDTTAARDTTASLIPFLSKMARSFGVASRSMRNTGATKTVPGYTALLTGWKEKLPNTLVSTFGIERPRFRPSHPTLFERLRKERGLPEEAAVLIASKRKLVRLAHSNDPDYGERFESRAQCGHRVLFGLGDVDDKTTYERAIRELRDGDPTLLVVAFAESDERGHDGNWDAYRAAIRQADEYTQSLWRFAQSLPAWRGRTTLIVSADHGRHLDGVKDGFKNHGCECEGCRRILFAGAGPDFRRGVMLDTPRDQTDVAATIAALLGLSTEGMEGRVMTELFGGGEASGDGVGGEVGGDRTVDTDAVAEPAASDSVRVGAPR